MQTTTNNPIANLTAAEANLAGQIHAVAGVLDGIATNSIDDAMKRLEEAARGVHSRLGAAMGTMARTVGEIVQTINSLAAETAGALTLNTAAVQPVKTVAQPVLPSPVATVQPADQTITQNLQMEEMGQNLHLEEMAKTPASEPETADQTMARVLLSPTARQHAQEAAQKARQATQTVETTFPPSGSPNTSCTQVQEAESASHTPTVAACSPTETAGQPGDEQRTTTRKRRGK